MPAIQVWTCTCLGTHRTWNGMPAGGWPQGQLAPKSVFKSNPRAQSSALVLVPGSESALRGLPGCFHAANQAPWEFGLSPVDPTRCKTPQQGFGQEHLACCTAPSCMRRQECVTRRLRTPSRGRMRFHITLQISLLPAPPIVSPFTPFYNSPHIPFQKVNTPYLNSAFV